MLLTHALSRSSLRLCGHARTGRAGLGNMLLPWARCEIFCHTHGAAMLAPRWTQPKIGPILRGERDKRFYLGMFSSRGYVRGPAKWWTLLRSSVVPESQADQALAQAQDGRGRPAVIEFAGLGDYFQGLLDHRDLLDQRLRGMLKPALAAMVEGGPRGVFIAAHVRRGDMRPLATGQPAPPGTRWGALEDGWFINAIDALRRTVGWCVPVVLFSDGRPEELSGLLALEQVSLAPPRPAIVDILHMARGRVLLATPGSTFSAWVAFLGQMPALWFPIDFRFNLQPTRPHWESYSDVHGHPPEAFAAIASKALTPP